MEKTDVPVESRKNALVASRNGVRRHSSDSSKGALISSMQFDELSDEALIILFQHVDFVTQLRIRRVCKRWRWLLSLPELSHTIHLTARSFHNQDFVMTSLFSHTLNQRPDGSMLTEEWTFTAPSARVITFDGLNCHQPTHDYITARALFMIAKRCPLFERLNLLRLGVQEHTAWDFFEDLPCVVSVANSTVLSPGLWSEEVFRGKEWVYVPILKIDNVLVGRGEAFGTVVEKLAWPYPKEQTAWLGICMAKLASDEHWRRWLDGMKTYLTFPDLPGLENTFKEMVLDGGIGKMLPKELTDWSTGKTMLELSTYIVARDCADLPRPPYNFAFESAYFDRVIRGSPNLCKT